MLQALVAHDSGGRCAFCVSTPCADVTCVLVFSCTMVDVGVCFFLAFFAFRALAPFAVKRVDLIAFVSSRGVCLLAFVSSLGLFAFQVC